MVRPFSESSEIFVGIIKHLHKFRTYTPKTLESIAEGYIWFADMDQMNDPFEGILSYPEYNGFDSVAHAELMWFGTEMVYKPALKLLREEFEIDNNKFFSKYRAIHIERFKTESFKASKQGCFSALTEFKQMKHINKNYRDTAKSNGAPIRRNNIKIQNEEIRMWSYYGDGLRGFRITYNPKSILELDDIQISFIEYRDSPELIDFGKYLWHLQYSDAQRYRAVMDNRLFRTKGLVWSYEKELRIRSYNQGQKKIPKNSITSITFGKKMPKFERQVIKILAEHKNPDVLFFEADIVDSAFGIAYIPMTEEDFLDKDLP